MAQLSVMIEQLLEIISDASEELGLVEHTNLGLNAIESELLYIDQSIEAHIITPSPSSLLKSKL